MVRPRFAVVFALSALLVLAFAGPASAQPKQQGLVNVNISDVTIQVPIAAAANICDTNVNVLARQLRAGGAECDSDAESGATIPWSPGNSNGNGPKQDGLVNVNVNDVIVQLPVAIAANVCDLNVNALAQQLRLGGATCDAAAEAGAGG